MKSNALSNTIGDRLSNVLERNNAFLQKSQLGLKSITTVILAAPPHAAGSQKFLFNSPSVLRFS